MSYGGFVAFVREDGLLQHSRGGWSVGEHGGWLYVWTADRGAIPFDRVIGCYETHEEAHDDHPRARKAADAYGDERGLLHPYPLFDSKFELVLGVGVRLPQAIYGPPSRLGGGLYLKPLDEHTLEFCGRRPIWFREYFDGVAKGCPITKNLLGQIVYDFVGKFKAMWRDARVSVSAEIANQQVQLYGR